ncbi:hypothetical protein [Aromatoleum toluclasticum]|uniref:hypothetical protein n=1 Tax=Aromatoleum toluclasticum TaxID=92003 RepID=UPI0012F8BC2E|nr:hypothetical protein [Aromatoleum toluclasticum]
MREKLAGILFLVILAYLTAFGAGIFNLLFVEANEKFAESASGAFLGAFLAFVFVRTGDFFKAYSDRVTKNHSTLVRLEHALNGLLSTLDDNIFVIETFDDIYKKYAGGGGQTHAFVWANRLHPVPATYELLPDLLNIDLVNELFHLNVSLRKLNESMETINGAYSESKEALISERIDIENYMANVTRIRNDLLVIKKFLASAIEETVRSLGAIRILAKKRPLIGYALLRLAGHKYSECFEDKRLEEVKRLSEEMESIKAESKKQIDKAIAQ